MLFNITIDLISTTVSTNEIGDYVEAETSNTVFADEKEVMQSEFYQAMAQGLKPERVFVIRLADYNDERIVEHENTRYEVIRTYELDGELIEIVAGNIVGTEVR